jgi:MFS family permease
VVCMLAIALVPREVAVAGIFLYQALCGASSPGVYAIAQILAGPAATGRWVGIQNAIGNLAGVAAPALTGLLVERTGQFTWAFALSAGVSLLGLYGWLYMIPPLAQLRWGAPVRAAS